MGGGGDICVVVHGRHNRSVKEEKWSIVNVGV